MQFQTGTEIRRRARQLHMSGRACLRAAADQMLCHGTHGDETDVTDYGISGVSVPCAPFVSVISVVVLLCTAGRGDSTAGVRCLVLARSLVRLGITRLRPASARIDRRNRSIG